MILARTVIEKFPLKLSEATIATVFTCYSRPEIDNDGITSTTIDDVNVDVLIKFCDSSSNGFPDIRGAGLVSYERTNETLAKPIASFA